MPQRLRTTDDINRNPMRNLVERLAPSPGAQPTRFVATYMFFRSGLAGTGARLDAYLNGTEGGVMDEPATAQALAAFLMRGVHCGAVSPDEVTQLTGASLETVAKLADRRVG